MDSEKPKKKDIKQTVFVPFDVNEDAHNIVRREGTSVNKVLRKYIIEWVAFKKKGEKLPAIGDEILGENLGSKASEFVDNQEYAESISKLRHILTSGHEVAIRAIQSNLIAFDALVRLAHGERSVNTPQSKAPADSTGKTASLRGITKRHTGPEKGAKRSGGSAA